MPKFKITIERLIPSFRERATVTVEAESLEEIEECFDPNEMSDVDIDWEEVMEGHGGFPIDYEINMINEVDSNAEVDWSFDSCFEEEKE